MKKFVFQLDSLYKVKKQQQERLQKEYAEAESLHANAVTKKTCLEKKIEYENALYENKARKGMTVSEIQANSVFFEDMEKRLKTAVEEAGLAGQSAERKRQELLSVFEEIKTLEKLRERQYEDYLAEVEKRERSHIEDLISFRLSDKNANLANP
ncbi:MAG: hypothetical protein EOM54_02200 [Clostridia bacterium]|nr:hypothetical protein [Clostridia bacterium]